MYTLGDLEFYVKEKGGRIYNIDEYKNNTTKLTFICKNGHTFTVTPVVARRDWCRKCTTVNRSKHMCSNNKHMIAYNSSICKYCESESQSSTNEDMVRSVFESTFNAKFPRTYPNWLIGKCKSGYGTRLLLLDGYNLDLKIAFDYDPKNMDTLDEKKRKCNDNGVRLIVIPYTNDSDFVLKKITNDKIEDVQ